MGIWRNSKTVWYEYSLFFLFCFENPWNNFNIRSVTDINLTNMILVSTLQGDLEDVEFDYNEFIDWKSVFVETLDGRKFPLAKIVGQKITLVILLRQLGWYFSPFFFLSQLLTLFFFFCFSTHEHQKQTKILSWTWSNIIFILKSGSSIDHFMLEL